MLTRLKVSGFKNLVDVDVRFGPFTCVAGANGVGKSNLFDAIQFLGALASTTLLEAAQSVRGSNGKTTDIRQLFHHVGETFDQQMHFEAEMIIPQTGIDDLGQKAQASITFLKYALTLTFKQDESQPAPTSLEILYEELTYIQVGEAKEHLPFKHTSAWRRSVVTGRRTSPFISTRDKLAEGRVIQLHQDGTQGRPREILARTLPRTVLSSVNAAESPTALLTRREMQSWRLLQLEPSALREPDTFTTPPGLGADGAHLAATLHYLARTRRDTAANGQSSTWVYEHVGDRLSKLIDDVRTISIDRDEKRQLLTMQVTDKHQTVHQARSLSDGTLRFLALAVLELEPQSGGLICLEEPENGIHPRRIPAMLQLLRDIGVNTNLSAGPDNPLRQVIVNTHSPDVVSQVADDSLLIAELKEVSSRGQRFTGVRFSWLPDTWRVSAEPGIYPVAKGNLLDYLNPARAHSESASDLSSTSTGKIKESPRVIDRPDLQLYLPGLESPVNA